MKCRQMTRTNEKQNVRSNTQRHISLSHDNATHPLAIRSLSTEMVIAFEHDDDIEQWRAMHHCRCRFVEMILFLVRRFEMNVKWMRWWRWRRYSTIFDDQMQRIGREHAIHNGTAAMASSHCVWSVAYKATCSNFGWYFSVEHRYICMTRSREPHFGSETATCHLRQQWKWQILMRLCNFRYSISWGWIS